MLFALEDQTYVERSISDGASIQKIDSRIYTSILVRGGDVEYLTNGLVADDKKSLSSVLVHSKAVVTVMNY